MTLIRGRWLIVLLACLTLGGLAVALVARSGANQSFALPHEQSIHALALSPDGHTLIAATTVGIQRWSWPDRQPQPRLEGNTFDLAYSPDGQRLAALQHPDDRPSSVIVRIWRTTAQVEPITIDDRTPFVTLAWSRDSTLLATSYGPIVRVWRIGDAQATLERTLIPVGGAAFTGLTFAPDGRTIVALSDDGLFLWDFADGQQLPTLEYRADALVFSPDGQWLTIGSAGIEIRRAANGPVLRSLGRADEGVTIFAVSPDGRYFAAGGGMPQSVDSGRKYPVRLWRVADGQLVTAWEGHRGGVRAIIFSPDGRTVISEGFDNTIRWWQVP
jgi:WD40 repeat protein